MCPSPVAARRKNREKLAWSLMCGFAMLAVVFALWTYLHPRSAGRRPSTGIRSSSAPILASLLSASAQDPPWFLPTKPNWHSRQSIRMGLIKLWTRSLKASDATAVPGTDGAAAPFWSPDGRSLGFFAGGKLKTVELSGGNLQVLADSSSPSAAAWAPDGTILFKPTSSSPLFRISAAGGKAVPFGCFGRQRLFRLQSGNTA